MSCRSSRRQKQVTAYKAAYHDEDFLRTGADPLLCLLWLVRVWHTELDIMRLLTPSTGTLVDGVERLLLAAPQLDAAELSAVSNAHE